MEEDTDPEEYQDLVSFDFYSRRIGKKKMDSGLLDIPVFQVDQVQLRHTTASGPGSSFGSENELRVETYFEVGPSGTLKKTDALNFALADIEGESKTQTVVRQAFKFKPFCALKLILPLAVWRKCCLE